MINLVSYRCHPSQGVSKLSCIQRSKKRRRPFKLDTPSTSITGNLKPSNYPVLWTINDTMTAYIVNNSFYQNKDGDFEQFKRVYHDKNRCLNITLLDRKLDGDLVARG